MPDSLMGVCMGVETIGRQTTLVMVVGMVIVIMAMAVLMLEEGMYGGIL